MFKKIIDVLLGIWLLFLGQVAVGLPSAMGVWGLSPRLRLVAGLGLGIIVLGVYLFVAYYKGLLTRPVKKWYSHRLLGMALAGWGMMYAWSVLCNLVLALTYGGIRNQEVFMSLFDYLPKLVLFLYIVILAPIGEELVCRGIIPSLFCHKRQMWGYIVGTIVFAALHVPTNLMSWLLFGGMGAILAWVRHQTKHLEYSILVHALNNLLAFALLMLI